jgi:hypothetical protein
MKQLILSVSFLMLSMLTTAQVYKVTFTKCQNFTHPAYVSTEEAIELDLIEYPNYTVGENVFKFDYNARKLTIERPEENWVYDISEINENSGAVLSCFIEYENLLTWFRMGQLSENETQFIMVRKEGDQIVGFFSMNSDFSYTVE